MNKQFDLLLEESLKYYLGRQLKKALNTAQIALEFGKNAPLENLGLANAYLLLANIYNTNALYQHEPTFYSKAFNNLDAAKALNQDLPSQALNIDLLITEGKINHNSKEILKSRECFEAALKLAQQSNQLPGMVNSWAGLGHIAWSSNDPVQALEYAKGIEALLKNKPPATHSRLYEEMYLLFSQAFIMKQDYSKSLEMSQKLLQLSRVTGDVEKELVALRNIAVVCGVKSNYKIGMQYFLEALDKCEAIGYREMIVQNQINIGTLYAHLYNYEEAIKRYENVLTQHIDLIDLKTRTVVFNNLGNIFLTSDKPETAINYFRKAHQIAEENEYLDLLAYTLAQLSRTNIALDDFLEAALNAQLAKQLFDKSDFVNGKQINLLNLGNIAFREHRFDDAIQLAEQTIKLTRQLKDDTSEIKGYKLLAMIAKAKGDYQKALEYQEQYSEMLTEFAKVQRNRLNLDMEIRHAIREKQKEIELLTKENEYQSQLLLKSELIARQNEELLVVNEDLRQFAYIASHDLKEPLRMIGSFTQIIQKVAKPHLLEKDQEYFRYINEGVNRMNNLLDGLLRYSTVNRSQDEMVNIEMNDIFHLAAANLKFRIIETNAVIERGELPALKGTQQLYVQLFQNLISNALKFVAPGTQPYVKVTAEEVGDTHIISVSDNGIGISLENHVRIFDIFKRLHHQTEYEGTGIGLAICQKIAKRLGGSIRVESELGKGATFSFVLAK